MPEGGYSYSIPGAVDYEIPEGAIPKTSGTNFFGGGNNTDLGDALGTLAGGIGNIVRSSRDNDDGGVMGLGNPFDPKYADEARAKVDTEYGKLLEQLGGIVNDIAYLTGIQIKFDLSR